MSTAAHEWSPSKTVAEVNEKLSFSSLYQRLSGDVGGSNVKQVKREATALLNDHLEQIDGLACDLPDHAEDLEAWVLEGSQLVTAKYCEYLATRKSGGPRQLFANRAHALYFLRAVAPTKLVDGAWLYGLLKYWKNPKFSHLIRTYLEELGEGASDKNHVLIYRQLLSRHGLDAINDLDDNFYIQGLIQLALAGNAEDYLPEVIGFNLGYEQLPLHLLITAYELNELGIDPYYFTLHVTVDNSDTGHARRAAQAVMDNLPKLGDANEFWRRVRLGYGLSNAGAGTTEVIEGFDIEHEVVRVLSNKSGAGHGVHSDYCRIAGRNVNDWLARKQDVPEFLNALQHTGWIQRGAAVENSRFWRLLQGSNAEMFGVFSSYELQVIHDWIRGDESSDGKLYSETTGQGMSKRPNFRVANRLVAARLDTFFDAASNESSVEMPDSDLVALIKQLPTLASPGQALLLMAAMSPAQHWIPSGLHATRLFSYIAL